MVFEIDNYTSLKKTLDSLCEFLQLQKISSEVIFHSKLIACELLGNVLKHSNGVATLKGELKEDILELAILSKFPFLPNEVELPDLFSEHGRGLYLVQAFSESIERLSNGILIKIKTK